jgi:hypothetical protein
MWYELFHRTKVAKKISTVIWRVVKREQKREHSPGRQYILLVFVAPGEVLGKAYCADVIGQPSSEPARLEPDAPVVVEYGIVGLYLFVVELHGAVV